MKIKLTTLSENTAGMGDFLAEWGFSVLIDTDGYKVLFDTGAGQSVIHNADSLGVDLKAVDRIVLSHGHHDHTGGLQDTLKRIHKEIEIIAHPDVWQNKYDIRGKNPPRYIGIPFHPGALESLGARFKLTAEPVEIATDMMTSGEVPMVTGYEAIDSALYVKKEGGFSADQVKDDQAVIIKGDNGLIVVLGCAHRGMINTLIHAQNITGIQKIQAVMGGSHLIGASEERLWQTIAALKDLEIQKLALCHCTDLPVISVLAHEFGDVFSFNKAGSVLSL